MEEDEGARELLRALRLHGSFVVALGAASAVIGLVVGFAAPHLYTSDALVSIPAAAPAGANATDLLPGSQLGLVVPPGTTLLVAQRVAASGMTGASADASVEASIDEKRWLLVVRVTSRRADKARDGAEQVAAAAQKALAEGGAYALRSQTALLLASTRLDISHAKRGLAFARALLAGSPAKAARADRVVADALEAQGTNATVARASDPGDAWLRVQTARLALQEALLEARVASLEELAHDPEPILALTGQGRDQKAPAPVVLPAVEQPRRATRNAAAGGVLGVLAGLAIVFFREATASQRAA